MSNFTIGKKIILGFLVILAIMVALGLFSRSRLSAIGEDANVITTDCLPGVYDICLIRGQAKENFISLLRILTADEKKEIEDRKTKLKEGREKISKTGEEYAKTIFLPRDRELFDAINAPRAEYVNAGNKAIELADEGKTKEALALLKSSVDPAYAKYMIALNNLVDFNKENGDAASVKISSSIAQAQWGVVFAIGIALLFGGSAAFLIIRSVNGSLNAIAMNLRSSAEQVFAAASQVAQSSQSMASGASEQASSLEETSASLEEMASMTRQNADNARSARAVSDEASSAAESGQSTSHKMGSEIKSRIDGMNAAIKKIKTSADQTAKIIKTIDEIAFQTNLLALNAAVEAARAGEAGKGFAVVAEEVRNLAQRSAEAAKNTAALIEESQHNAENGVKASAEVSEILKRAVEVEIAKSFANTVEAANKVKQLIGEVAAASDEQSKGVEQINMAVSEMDKVTQSNAANAEETASASEELSAQSRELQDMVNALIKLIRGGDESLAQPGAARVEIASAARSHIATAPARKENVSSPPKSAKAPVNRVAAHVNGTSNGNGKHLKPSTAIPLTDEELSGF